MNKDDSTGDLRFQVLGPMEGYSGDRTITPSAPKIRRVLALLVFRANIVVSTGEIIQELWESEPPRSATTTAQTYVYQLRKVLNTPRFNALITEPYGGYRLRVEAELLDFRVFDRLVREGTAMLHEQHEPGRASKILSDALAVWRGPSLSNVECGQLLETHVRHIEEVRMCAVQSRIEADLELGRERALVPELQTLVTRHPLNEWFHTSLIKALYRSGRRADALEAFGILRRTLREELGLDLSVQQENIHKRILSGHLVPSGYVSSGNQQGRI